MKKIISIFVVVAALLCGCQKQQKELIICPFCDEEIADIEYCNKCGKPLYEEKEPPATEDLEYTLLDDGTYAVSAGDAKYRVEIIIPSQYNGKTVSKIAQHAFMGCINLTEIIIPDCVKEIPESAFYFCVNLTGITIPNNVTAIGISAFDYCKSLTNIIIPNSVTEIKDNAFRDCISLTSIKFNGTVAQWNSVKKGAAWDHNVPATVVVCTDGEVNIK